MKSAIDRKYLKNVLERLLAIPSPTGMTDAIVNEVCCELKELGIKHELTRRGAIRAFLKGKKDGGDRAIISHVDTLGAMVKSLKDNGRLEVVPVGHWSARFAEGARVNVHIDGERTVRGTALPLKASGHTYGDEVDTQPGVWANLEIRLDEKAGGKTDLERLGVKVGDFVTFDPGTEFSKSGFVNSRHLDDKAGVAAVLAAAKAIVEGKVKLSMSTTLIFTISEEVGAGASHTLHGDVSELISVDNGTLAPDQNTHPFGVTIAMQDMAGPFDWYLTRELISVCEEKKIPFSRDVFRYYRSDAASAVDAGNDIRTALVCFALDASHGWERTHLDSLTALGDLLYWYVQRPMLFARDVEPIGPREDLPKENV